MKKILLSVIALSSYVAVQAQCNDLIISEYVEGTNNNKALEIYNASSSPISLANYRILRHDNGNPTFTAVEGEMQLPTNITLAPYQAYVIALNLTDPNGTGQSAPIDVNLQAVADTLLCPGCGSTGQSRVMCFNGDDALSLEKNVNGTWTKIDIFACIGERPANSSGTFSPTGGWTILAPYSSMPVGYDANVSGPYYKQYWSQDKTLKRKPSITSGVTTNPAFESFNASVQWDSLPVNTFTGLGTHTCDCFTNGINDANNSFAFSIFPNPSSEFVKIQSSTVISKAVFYNLVGQEIKSFVSKSNLAGTALDITALAKGIYTIVVFDDKNNKSINKVIIK
ncbi:MAG: lamin tail domain-containing protein [Bacteroidia bacterium]